MPTPPDHTEASARLARIQRLWKELSVTCKDTPQYRVLMKQIRDETDAFRKTLIDDPNH